MLWKLLVTIGGLGVLVILMIVIAPGSAATLDNNLSVFYRFALVFMVCRVLVIGSLFTWCFKPIQQYVIHVFRVDISGVRQRWGLAYLVIEMVILLQILWAW